MRDQRTDYRLRRRATLQAFRDGAKTRDDVCDAHPDLVRAGIHIGTVSTDACPICDEAGLRLVTYAYPRLSNGRSLGGAVRTDDLSRRAARYGELDVFEVEVCVNCHWHHLRVSYVHTPHSSASNG